MAESNTPNIKDPSFISAPVRNNIPFEKLEKSVYAAVETYSNIHRGSGHFSMVTTRLYEESRKIILKFTEQSGRKKMVIFSTPVYAEILTSLLRPGSYKLLSSEDFGLALGVRALVVKKRAFPRGAPLHPGGGTTRLISKNWVIWADAPAKFEPGTPAVLNILTFARALKLMMDNETNAGSGISEISVSDKGTQSEDDLKDLEGKDLLSELLRTIPGRGVSVPTATGMKPYIHLDNSASTPAFKPVWDTFRKNLFLSMEARRKIIQEVRIICAKFLEAPVENYELIFTSNTTEAINLVADDLYNHRQGEYEELVLGSLLEHSSNDLPWRKISGNAPVRLPVDEDGLLSMEELETILKAYNEDHACENHRIRIVAISGASNVLGSCNELEEIARITHHYGAELLVDAAQLVAHSKINMLSSGIDYLAFSAHKIYAPFGCGVLVARKGLLRFNNAELEGIQAAGEENSAGIAALGKALVLLQRIGMELIREKEQILTERALSGLSRLNGVTVYGMKSLSSEGQGHRIGVVAFSTRQLMPNHIARDLAAIGGIGVRYGCHCAHILVKHILHVSPGLERFQRIMQTLVPALSFPGVVRMSLGLTNSEEDVDQFIETLRMIIEKKFRKEKMERTGKHSGKELLPAEEVKKLLCDFSDRRVSVTFNGMVL